MFGMTVNKLLGVGAVVLRYNLRFNHNGIILIVKSNYYG